MQRLFRIPHFAGRIGQLTEPCKERRDGWGRREARKLHGAAWAEAGGPVTVTAERKNGAVDEPTAPLPCVEGYWLVMVAVVPSNLVKLMVNGSL